MANEVDIILKAVDEASAEINNVNKALGGTDEAVKKASFSFTELSSMMNVAQQAFGYAKQAFDATAGAAVEYADDVRALQQVTGASAEETSRLIQVLDDYKVSTGDAMAAQRALTKDGIVLTTQSLAQLSKEYLAITGQAERNAFAQEKLGRNYKAFIEVLQQGPDAINRMSDAVSENLILTQDAVDAAREYQMVMDDLGDTFDGIKIGIGTKVVPAFNNFVKAVQQSIEEQGIFKTGFTDIIYYFNQLSEPVDSATRSYTAMAQAYGKMADAGDDTDPQAQAEAEKARADAITAQTKEYQSLLSLMGDIQSSTDSYTQKQADLTAKMAENRAEAEKLYPWQSGQLDELNTKYAEMQGQYADNTAAFIEASNAKIVQMLLEKDATDGLTQAEFERNVKLQEAYGIIDAKTAEQAIRMNELTDAMANTALTAGQVKAAIDLLPSGKTIDVIMNIIAQNVSQAAAIESYNATGESFRDQRAQKASGTGGEWMTVPPGYNNDNYTVGMSSGEKYAVTTQGQSAGGGTATIASADIEALGRMIVNALQKDGR